MSAKKKVERSKPCRSDAPTCSACLDTPESDAMYNYCVQNSGPMSVIRMLLKMRELERERDLARRGILCAINGIGLMGEISYDCRGERDYHAKKVIGLLESYLISPQNAATHAPGANDKPLK